MAERRIKIPFPNPDSALRDGVEVPVVESTERWTEVRLEDGSTIRVKPSVVSAVRIDGEWDPEGNPAYSLKIAPAMTIIVPDALKKPTTPTPIQ